MKDAGIDNLELLLAALGSPLGPVPSELRARYEGAGGLLGLWHAGPDPVFDAGSPEHARFEAFAELGRRLLTLAPNPAVIDCPQAVLRYVGPRLAVEPQETFWIVALDARGHALALHCVARGTLSACLVHPREVFAPALRCRAHALIVVHNHPSGDPEPSVEDTQLTARLEDAGQLLGIPLVDHVVVGRRGFRSLCGTGRGPWGAQESDGAERVAEASVGRSLVR